MMCEKGKALYDRAQVRVRSGSTSSASYRRHVFIDEDGVEHDPEHCSFRMVRPQIRHHDDSNSDCESDPESDDTLTDDGLSLSSRPHSNCCFQGRQRVGSVASSSFSADYPPPTSSLYPPHVACSHRPNVPLRERYAPNPRRPSLPLLGRLSSHHPRPHLTMSASVPLAGTSGSPPWRRTYYDPQCLSLASDPPSDPTSLPSAPTPFVIVPIPGDGLEDMPLTRQYLESGRVMEELPRPKPIQGFRRRYQSLKFEWDIGIMRSRKKLSKVFKRRQH